MCWALQPNPSIQSGRAAAVPMQRSRWPGADFEGWAPPTGKITFKKTQFLIFIVFFSVNIGANATDLQRATTIELSNPSDVRDAKILNNAVDAMSNKVMECVKNKTTKSDECYCLYPGELDQLRNAYESTLELHPGWQDQVIFWWRDDIILLQSFIKGP